MIRRTPRSTLFPDTTLFRSANAPEARRLDRELVVTTAAAPPSPTILARMEELGARVVHVYGLTETYGPYTVNQWQPSWAQLDRDRKSTRLNSSHANISYAVV